jgi:hypothetical protein
LAAARHKIHNCHHTTHDHDHAKEDRHQEYDFPATQQTRFRQHRFKKSIHSTDSLSKTGARLQAGFRNGIFTNIRLPGQGGKQTL